MKKVFVLLVVLSAILVACTVTPTNPVLESVTVPTQEATSVPSEEPTIVPTEEPTIVPTEEPTIVPTEELPESCPLEAFDVPEDITMDLGIYGEFELNDAIDFSLFIMNPQLLMEKRQGEDVVALYNDGGSFSFQMPSWGFIYSGKNTSVTVNEEFWGEEGIAISESGNFVIPAGAQVTIDTAGGFEGQESPIEVYFLSGAPIKGDEITLPENATLSCSDLWQITIDNVDSNDIELVLNTGHYVIFTETEGDILGVKYPNSPDFVPFSETIFRDGMTLQIKGGGSITGWVFDLYDKE